MTNEDEDQLIAPVVSLGGTSVKALLDDILSARYAIINATDKVIELAPHLRDFVDQEARYRIAVKQHTDRIVKLQTVALELLEIAQNICDQEVPK